MIQLQQSHVGEDNIFSLWKQEFGKYVDLTVMELRCGQSAHFRIQRYSQLL